MTPTPPNRNRKLIAGNWKMNMNRAAATAFVQALTATAMTFGNATDIVICPPFTLLDTVKATIAGAAIHLGAQDCHAAASGAYTGNISAAMLVDAGVSHVILGHSERRVQHAETSAEVAAKATAAHQAGLIAIICVGESRAERDSGQAEAIVAAQIAESLPASVTAENTVIAYEPVWAIGTGLVATPEDVAAMHAAIRGFLALRDPKLAESAAILYGGSVKADNAKNLLALADVDGALVGGASLEIDSFNAIIASS